MLNGRLSRSLAAVAVISLTFLAPALCESEAGGFVFGGGESESGGAELWGDSQSGGVLWGRNESGGVRDSGAESDSGGMAEVGNHNEAGGATGSGAETQAEPMLPTVPYVQNY